MSEPGSTIPYVAARAADFMFPVDGHRLTAAFCLAIAPPHGYEGVRQRFDQLLLDDWARRVGVTVEERSATTAGLLEEIEEMSVKRWETISRSIANGEKLPFEWKP